MLRFRASIRRAGVLRVVTVPPGIVAALGGAARIAVVARYAGEATETTLVPAGGARRRLTLRMDVLRPAGLDAGDAIEVELTPDRRDRDPPLPVDFAEALRFRPAAQATLAAATISIRRQIVAYLEAAKKPATRRNRLEQLIEKLAAGEIR